MASGELQGLLIARDTVLPTFLGQFNNFAGTLASEFNKVYASGQGLHGFTTATSESAVDDPNQSLADTGLAFSPVNGSFQISVQNKTTGLTKRLPSPSTSTAWADTTLYGLAARVNNVSGDPSHHGQRQPADDHGRSPSRSSPSPTTAAAC